MNYPRTRCLSAAHSSSSLLLLRSAVGLAALALLGSAGCAMNETGDVDSDQAALIGGVETSNDPAVALLLMSFTDNTSSICTGTLISPRVLLTASHCLLFPEGKTLANYTAYFGDNALNGDPDGDADRIAAIAITDGLRTSEFDINTPENGFDVGLVLLASPAPIPPVLINRAPLENHIGEPMRMIGWGVSTINPDGSNGAGSGVKREGFTTLQEVAAPHLTRFGTAASIGCRGDSGGPQFMMIDGEEVIVSVNSFGDTGCTQYNYGTRIDAFATNFIDTFVSQNDPATCEADFRCVAGCDDPDCGADECDAADCGYGDGSGDGDGNGSGSGEGGSEDDGSKSGGVSSSGIAGGCSSAGQQSGLSGLGLLLLAAFLVHRRRRN